MTSIGKNAFTGCNTLLTVSIPNSVTTIGDWAFQNCSGLTSVTIPNSITTIGIGTFKNCSSLTSVTIPNSVELIKVDAFNGCSNLTTLIIGSGIKSIYTRSFAFCTELTDVFCYAENVPSTNTDVFNDSYIESAILHVPTASINAYKATEPWSNFKTIVGLDGTLPDNPNPDDPDNPDPDNPNNPQCATPTIIIIGNKVKFECETPGAEFTSKLTAIEEFAGNELILGGTDITYTLTVYATAPDYNRSKPATAKITINRADVNCDGQVGIGDIVEITNIMAGLKE